MLCERRWSDTGPGSGVGNIYCREPKTGLQKVQLYSEDNPLCPSTEGILFIYGLNLTFLVQEKNMKVMFSKHTQI